MTNATMEKQAGGAKSGLVVALLVAGTFFMENLDATVIAPAVPQMAKSFSVAPVDLNTGISAYMLTLGVFIPVSGWVADRFGARKVFAIAIAVFTIASLFCGLARTLPEFVAMRILQGIGGAMMVPVGRLVVLRVTPKEKLIGAIAALTWPALVAPVLGPPLGGLIADTVDWRWIFYLNLPLGIVAFGLAWALVPDTRGDGAQPFDWPGFVLGGGSLFCLLYAADTMGQPVIAWERVAISALLGAGLMVAAVRHLTRTKGPMIELSSLRVQTFAVTIWGGSLFRMGVSAVPFLLPLMFQIGYGYDAFEAGLMLMAVFAGNLLIKPLTTPVLRRFGFRPVLIVNGLINAAAIGACAFLSPAVPLPVTWAVLFVSGMSRSMQFTAFNTIAFADIPRPAMSAANTLFSTAFQLAMGLGVALGAVAWRLGEALTYPAAAGSGGLPFHIAFVVVALVSLSSIADSLKLPADAGQAVAKASK